MELGQRFKIGSLILLTDAFSEAEDLLFAKRTGNLLNHRFFFSKILLNCKI